VPLPNGLHYEWAMRALRAGKHVLLEKPFTSNAIEARALVDFHSSLPSTPEKPRPILLEAVHCVFHPAFQTFLSLLSRDDIAEVQVEQAIPAGVFNHRNIRFQYDLAGGALMDFGTYNVMVIRQIFGTEPVHCTWAKARTGPAGWDPKCDVEFRAQWQFPNGGIARMYASLAATRRFWAVRVMDAIGLIIPNVTVTHKEVAVIDTSLDGDQTHLLTRTVHMDDYMAPHIWHRIDVADKHVIKNVADGRVLKTWMKEERIKAYTWGGLREEKYVRTGTEFWSTYRHMIEQFVNAIKGRPGSGVWIDGESSVKQMAMVDSGYEKAGLSLRPTSASCVYE